MVFAVFTLFVASMNAFPSESVSNSANQINQDGSETHIEATAADNNVEGKGIESRFGMSLSLNMIE